MGALAGAGPLTVDQVAAKVTVDPALVREWLRAQAAGGYLDYDPDTERYTLPDAVAGAILYGPGGPLVDAAATMMSSMGEGFGDFSEAFSTGRGYGWHQRTADHWHGTDAFTKVALPTELIAAAIAEITDVATVLDRRRQRRGRWLRLRGTDPGHRRPVPGRAGAGDRLPRRVDRPRPRRVRRQRRRQRPVRGGRRGRPPRRRLRPDHLLRLAARHRRPPWRARPGPGGVAPTGAVLLFEPLSADNVEDNLNPMGRMFYAVSTLACTPNAVSQTTATSSEPLGAQAGEKRLRELAAEAGFTRVRRLGVEAPMNLVLELRP